MDRHENVRRLDVAADDPFRSACRTPSQTWLKSSRRSLMVKRCLSQYSLIGIPNDERPPVDLKTVRRATDSDISIQMTAASSRSPKWPRSFWPRRSRSSSSTVLRHRTCSPAVASGDTRRPNRCMPFSKMFPIASRLSEIACKSSLLRQSDLYWKIR